MRFIYTTGWEDGIADLTERLVRELDAGKRVFWIVSGGSNIPASVKVMDSISAVLRRKLTVMLADERFGPVGHPDSNCAQMAEAGFDCAHDSMHHILQPGLSLAATTDHFRERVEQAFAGADVVIAQLGIGPDGHIAGILPGSPASRENRALVVGYEGQPFTRLTLTFPALRKVSAAYAFAFGDTKHDALQSLRAKRLSLEQQPAQILKYLPEAYVYNDQVA